MSLNITEESNENSFTNHEAVLCKVSADKCGLLPDKFISEFLHHPHHSSRRHSKPPIINRGTFLRTVSIDSIAKSFIKSCEEVPKFQIISLGAGFDTRLFRLVDEFGPKLLQGLTYFEVDFEQVIQEKKRIVSSSSSLNRLAENWRPISLDLNYQKLDFSSALGPDFKSDSPTLIIAECCLMYLTTEAGDNLISWAAEACDSVTFCSFDPILAEPLSEDPFARMMLENFEDRGLDTTSLLAYPSKESVTRRFASKFGRVDSCTMLQLEQDPSTEFLVSGAERHELALKAALDEYEEWNLLANHYLLIITKK